jgi:hypothetical protein
LCGLIPWFLVEETGRAFIPLSSITSPKILVIISVFKHRNAMNKWKLISVIATEDLVHGADDSLNMRDAREKSCWIVTGGGEPDHEISDFRMG